jgi:formamidopyrimidine-DNA glycosylase
MRTTPNDPAFTYEAFNALVDETIRRKKMSAKGLLTQEQLIPGLGNAIAQDILFQAQLHPKRSLDEMEKDQRKALYEAIRATLYEIIEKGGRYDEFDLYGNKGGYVRLMDKNAVGKECPRCGTIIKKIQYLGGACYFCPGCQS